MSKKSDSEAVPTGWRVDVAGALRDAGVIGLIAVGLFLPLIGFETVTNIRNELIVITRWPLLLALVVAIAVVRFVYSVALAPWLARRAARPLQAVPAWARQIRRWLVPFAIGFVV